MGSAAAGEAAAMASTGHGQRRHRVVSQQRGATGPLRLAATMALALGICMCSAATDDAANASGPASNSNKPETMILFDQGENALSWDNDELTRVRNLHSKDLSNKEEFMGSPTLAAYLGVSPIEALHFPLPLNIVLVGFAADGNMAVNISLPEVNRWFEHLDHILPHTRIDQSEISCQEDGQCAGLVHGRYAPSPMPSYVHYNFTCNVVLIRKRLVVDTFERATAAFSRPVDPAIETGAQQVDASKMEAFIDHFLGAIGLDMTYSVVLLNPQWHADEPVYGYRQGLSAPELQVLHGNASRVRDVAAALQGEPEPELPPHKNSGGGFHRDRHRGYYGNLIAPKFTTQDALWDSDAWVVLVDDYLKAENQYRAKAIGLAGSAERGAAGVAQAARIMNRPSSALGAILRLELSGAWDSSDELHTRFRTSHPAEDCMVNTWVGAGSARWALADLTAGAKDWGPALGGDGVVHYHSLPHVHELFGQLKAIKDKIRLDAQSAGSLDLEVKQALEREKSTRVPAVANKHYHAFMQRRQAAQRAAGAPGALPLDPAKEAAEYEAWRKSYHETLLQAELDLLEEFALRHCNKQANPPLLCGQLNDEVVTLRSQLTKLHAATGSGSAYDTSRSHKWDIFGVEPASMAGLHPQLTTEAGRAHDLFMGELSGILSRAIRHVIAPPTLAWMPRLPAEGAGPSGVRPRTTAPPFAKKVHFNIHIITDATRATMSHHANPGAASHMPGMAAFDLPAYKAAVETLKLYNQVFTFSTAQLSLQEEPALASAVAAATKTTIQEIPSTHDYIEAEMERSYIDSRELAHSLRLHFGEGKQPSATKAGANGRERVLLTNPSREVAVYVLQLERDVAILLDEHYNARALHDMVLVVANAARRDEHPTGMMCGGALLARPLSPLKESLAATLVHLGGVLPPHLGYNPKGHRVTHDWLWSVGSHPQSFTSTGTRYTQLQRDALARSYLFDALDTSVHAVNAAIGKLVRAKPSKALYKHIMEDQSSVRDLLRKFNDVVNMWRSVVTLSYTLDFATALEYLPSLESDVDALAINAKVLSELSHGPRCSNHMVDRVAPLVPFTYVSSALVVVAAMLYAAWPAITAIKAKKS